MRLKEGRLGLDVLKTSTFAISFKLCIVTKLERTLSLIHIDECFVEYFLLY